MPLSPTERARVASTARWSRTPAPERSAHARRIRTDLEAYVRAVVDRAPELTDDQRTRLAALLEPSAVPAPNGALAGPAAAA